MNSQIRFLRRVRIHGEECGAVARALHHEVKNFSSPAVIENVSITTFERKSMSNKTFFKRVALAIVAAIALVSRRPFLLLSVDDGLARTSGFSARLFHNVMLTMVAITVIASFQTVGTLLVLGMLIAPAATGSLFARRIESMMLTAAIVGSLSTYVGLLISYHYDLAAGASIVLTAVVIFALAAIANEIRKSRSHEHHDHEHPHVHGEVHVR